MTDTKTPQIVETDREHNPKAVFFGTDQNIINPLALYLDSHNVELFSGKNLHDAFFGDYFFYVGEMSLVKEFVVNEGKKLPKSVFLCYSLLGQTEFENLFEQLTDVKLIWVERNTELTSREVVRIVEFLFNTNKKVMMLRPFVKKNSLEEKPLRVDKLVVSEVSPKVLPEAKADMVLAEDVTARKVEIKKTEVVKTHEKIPFLNEVEEFHSSYAETKITTAKSEIKQVEINAQLTKPSSQLGMSVQGFYADASPKRSGASVAKKKRLPLFLASFIGLILFILFPVLVITAEHALAFEYIQMGKKALLSQETERAEKNFKNAKMYANLGVKNIEFFSSFLSIIKQKELYAILYDFSQIQANIAAGAYSTTKAAKEGSILFVGISGQDKGISYGQLISAIRGHLTLADTEFAHAQARLKTLQTKKLPEKLGKYVKGWHDEVTGARATLTSAQGILAVTPQIIGLYGKRSYLLLFQNNMELRPSGGFIGSFGLITFEEGRLTDLKIEDIYTADGALKGHIEPPAPIKLYLSQEHWFMRDSNWDPDFEISGARAAWFLEKELGISVDGVIALDLSYVSQLLSVVGPLTIPEYPEPISDKNLFLATHNAIHDDFFPGSTKKRDLLGAIGRRLIDQLLLEKNIKTEVLIKIYEGLVQKHAMAYFSSLPLQNSIKQLGWAGSYNIPDCSTLNCFSDFLRIVDANLGVNKVNYYIEKKSSDKITINSDGTITHALAITYKNNAAKNDTQVGGVYKNYVRVFVPASMELIEAKQGTIVLSKEAGEVASASSVLVTKNQNNQSFATFLEVEPESEQTLAFTYKTIGALNENNTYALYLQKQPGTQNDPIAISLRHPQNWTTLVNPQETSNVASAVSLATGNEIGYTINLLTDYALRVSFERR